VLIAATVFGILAVLFHVMAFVLESVLWTRPAVFARFGIASAAEAETIRPMAYNQGFYNLALAIGVAVGLVLLSQDGDALIVGKTLVAFGTACMAVAGLVLASTGSKYLRSAVPQFVPAALTLALVLAS
jgi:putative membrane protein